MRFHADLHIHSKYSRATSRDLDLEHLAAWAGRKGVSVVGTGDFTHPAWRAELKEKLVPAEPGLFRLRDDLARAVAAELPAACVPDVRFMLQVEISTIYKKGDRTRKVHHLIYAPDFATADRFSERLGRIGNITSDGRPILGLDSRHLLEIALESGPDAYLIPAHIWTPWFAVLGSMSGFDSIVDCYGDLSDHIFAVETGLSSDPPMNWRLSMLDRYRLVSNSDAHSPGKLGREATTFDTARDYYAIRRALETGEGFVGTVEFFPEEGKYHLDGHRKCGVRLTPTETLALDALCPTCRQPLTVGVLHRAEKLADRPEGCAAPATAGEVTNLVPLPEVLSELASSGAASKTVTRCYDRLVSTLGPELWILNAAPLEDIARAESSLLAEAITRLRAGQVIRDSGYDGEYGVIRLFEEQELKRLTAGGNTLFDTGRPTKAMKPQAPTTKPDAPATKRAAGKKATAAADLWAPASVSTGGEGTPQAAVDSSSIQAAAAGTGTADATTPDAPQPASPAAAPRAEASVLDGLDPDQRRAASAVGGPLLIVAGPGSGKTRTVTHRIAHLVKERGVPAASCLAITFTRRAAAEMRERLARLLPSAAETGGEAAIHTFHSLGLEILREQAEAAGLPRGFRIASELERVALLREVMPISERKAQTLLRAISKAKRAPSASPPGTHTDAAIEAAASSHASSDGAPSDVAVTDDAGSNVTAASDAASSDAASSSAAAGTPPTFGTLADAGANTADTTIADASAAYHHALAARGWLDFDDLVCLPVRLLTGQPALAAHYRDRFRWLSVDEFQDVDDQQYRLLTLLAPADGNLCVIGDPNQAIYGFRGADASCFARFARDFPTAVTVALSRNYRSSGTIVSASSQVITTIASSAADAASAPPPDGAPRHALAQIVRGMHERITIQATPTDRAEAEFVVQTIERLMGGHSLLAIDRGHAEGASATSLGFADFAVLFRTSAQATLLVDAFARSGIPFKKHAHDPLASQPAVRAVLHELERGWADAANDASEERANEIGASEREANESGGKKDGAHDDDLASQIRAAVTAVAAAVAAAAAGTVGIGAAAGVGAASAIDAESEPDAATQIAAREQARDRLLALAASCQQDRARFTDALALATEADFYDPRADRVSLLTLHASKGLEFPVVFIVGLEDGLLPFSWDDLDPAAAAEERRLFYVGMTRAQDRLFLSRAQQRLWRGRLRTQESSPFLGDIEQELVKHHKTAPARKKPERAQLRLL